MEGYQRRRIAAVEYLCLLNPGTPLFNTSAPAKAFAGKNGVGIESGQGPFSDDRDIVSWAWCDEIDARWWQMASSKQDVVAHGQYFRAG